jgi:hypothetical protein
VRVLRIQLRCANESKAVNVKLDKSLAQTQDISRCGADSTPRRHRVSTAKNIARTVKSFDVKADRVGLSQRRGFVRKV